MSLDPNLELEPISCEVTWSLGDEVGDLSTTDNHINRFAMKSDMSLCSYMFIHARRMIIGSMHASYM